MAAFRPSAHGPDVAHYQHVTDEASVPEWELASCKLAEGRSYFDPTSPKWIALFRRKKVRCLGVYFWIRGDSPVEVQFANLVARLQQVALADGDDLDRGVMIQLDWERTYNNVNGQRVLVRDPTVAEIEQFIYLTHVRYGDREITYASDWVPGFYEWRRKHPTAPLWYANYDLTPNAQPTDGYAECLKYGAAVWQWTSKYKGGGIASGTPGKPETDTGYDMNHVFDWALLDRLCLNAALPVEKPPVIVLPPMPTPTPTTPSTPEGDDMRIVTNRDVHYGSAPRSLEFGYGFSANDAGPRLFYIKPVDRRLIGGDVLELTSAEIDEIGFATKPPPTAPTPAVVPAPTPYGPFSVTFTGSGTASPAEV